MDFLRILCAFAVIVLHVSAITWSEGNVNTSDWILSNAFDSIVRFCVPVFVMISGALFLGRNIAVKDIFKKYIYRLVIAYIIWSFVYALGLFVSGYGLERSVQRFLVGESHLWYIYMICGLYLITPFLRIIVQDDKLTRYFLALSFIFSIMLPYVLGIMGKFMFDSWIETLNSIVSSINLKFVMGYSFYYVLGYYLDMNKGFAKISVPIVIAGILSFGSTIALSTYDSIVTSHTSV